MDYFGSKSLKFPIDLLASSRWGLPDSHLDSVIRECARPYFHCTFLVDANA